MSHCIMTRDGLSIWSMEPSGQTSWKQVAWNGVELHVPMRWEPAFVGRDNLLFENKGKPAAQLKWAKSYGGFDAKKFMRRLNKLGLRTSLKTGIRRLGCYQLECRAFSWSGFGFCGHGWLMWCPVCHRACALRFFGDNIQVKLAEKLMDSYKCHPEHALQPWAIYDIRFEAPQALALLSHAFYPGRFEIRLQGKGHNILLLRFGPADMLVAGQNLEKWARAELPWLLECARAQAGGKWLVWEDKSPGTWLARVFARMKKGHAHRMTQLRLDKRANRILAVDVRAAQRLDVRLVEAVCSSYEALR